MAKLLGVLCFALLAATAAGTQYKVGGSGAWTPVNTMSYNQWAQHTRFKVGDSLLFVYPAQKDSVLQVDKAAYDNCTTTSYIQKYDDGNTVVKLDRSGAFFFISGIEVNCLRNESMHIVVLADRSKSGTGSNPPSLPPSPSPASATTPPAPATPAPAPMASSSPPPAPATPAPAPMASSSPPPAPESSSSPPPAPEASSSPPPAPESNSPPPAPEGTTQGPAPSAKDSTPPPNGASVKAMGFISSMGALIGYLLVL